jgi:hypothetical protein
MFELGDAVLSCSSVNSSAELSCSPLFRRQWSSLYEALQERTYEPQAAMLGNRPVGVGQGWSTLAWIPKAGSSWALPMRHERITSFERPISKAAWQLRQVTQALPTRAISLWDSEYGCASFVLATADIACDKLMRLRSNRCLWTAPPYGGRGRPRMHGDKVKLHDSTTWHSPDQHNEVNDPKQGRLRVRCWHQLHFRTAAKHPLHLILVERLDEHGNRCTDKPVWLSWVGEAMPALEQIWQLYCRRFGVDHWFRFAKQ